MTNELRAMKILIADDEPAARTLLTRALDRPGYYTTCVADGDACLLELKTRHYDALFLDLIMPGASAKRILQHVQTRLPKLKVLMISVADDERIVEELFASGAAAYLTKPFRPEQALAALESLCGKLPAPPPRILQPAYA